MISPTNVVPHACRRCGAVHHFDIVQNCRGLWCVTAWDGLIGGTFRSEKDAVRFAIEEASGDLNCVHKQDGSPGPRAGAVRRR